MIVYQNLRAFRLPHGFRGRPAVVVQAWWLVQATFFRWSPQFAYGFRRWLLRLFGAQVGMGVIVRPTVTITYPWHVSIGDFAWVGDDVCLYSLGKIEIGENAVVSQGTYVCAGDHDYSQPDFPIRARGVVIEPEVWVAAECYLAPGTVVGRGAVIGARSAVFSNMPAGFVCVGSPSRPIKVREMKGAS